MFPKFNKWLSHRIGIYVPLIIHIRIITQKGYIRSRTHPLRKYFYKYTVVLSVNIITLSVYNIKFILLFFLYVYFLRILFYVQYKKNSKCYIGIYWLISMSNLTKEKRTFKNVEQTNQEQSFECLPLTHISYSETKVLYETWYHCFQLVWKCMPEYHL